MDNPYKDGIGSAYKISTKLAEVVLTRGIDKRSLKKGYGPVIGKYQTNNFLGKLVFIFIWICFSGSIRKSKKLGLINIQHTFDL